MKTLLLFCFIFISIFGFSQEKRLALVIGNANYQYGGVLKNPVNDADLMASTLEDLGFDVYKKTNATKREIDLAVLDYWRKLAGYDVALFYYAGHGIQIEGKNYILPIDAKLEDELALQVEAVDIGNVVKQFEKFPNNINIVILDACRDNPFRSWMRSSTDGFAAMANPPSGTIIVFATSANATAADGQGANGLFTEVLSEQMRLPQRIEDVLINTRNRVRQASNGRQNPQEWSQLNGQFSFVPIEYKYADEPEFVETKEIVKYGNIELITELSGELYIDGNSMNYIYMNSIIPINQVVVGNHQLAIYGKENWFETVEVKDNQTSFIKAKSKSVNIDNSTLPSTSTEYDFSSKLEDIQANYPSSSIENHLTYLSGKVFLNNEKLSSREFKSLYKQSGSSALRTYRSGQVSAAYGWFGTTIGTATIITTVGLTISTGDPLFLALGAFGGVICYGGIACFKKSKELKANSVKIYNKSLKPQASWRLESSHNGIGLVYRF